MLHRSKACASYEEMSGSHTFPNKLNNYNSLSDPNCTKEVAPNLLPTPNLEQLSWNKVSTVSHNVAVLDWILFIIGFLMFKKWPRDKTSDNLTNFLVLVESVAKKAAEAVIGLLLIVICLPTVLPVILMFALYSELVRIIYWCKYGGNATKAAPLDAIWGESSESKPYINVAMTMNGTPSVEKVREVIQRKLLDVKDENGLPLYRKFSQIINKEYGYYMWKDALGFDIKNHVWLWKDSHNNTTMINNNNNTSYNQNKESFDNIGEPETGTKEVIKRYMNKEGWTSMKPNMPMWEIILLDNHNLQPGKYAVVIRLHHAIGDGISLLRLILGELVDTPVEVPSKNLTHLNPFLWLAAFLYSMCMLPMEFMFFYQATDNSPIHDAPLLGRKVYRQSNGVPLSTLKAIKNASGTTINDVLMSCVSAAFARTFSNRCGSSILTAVPISNHPPTKNLCPVNKSLMWMMQLPTPLSTPSLTPHGRLTLVKSACDKLKTFPGLMANNYMIRLMARVLPVDLVKAIMVLPGLSMGASNVPGPAEEISLWGDGVTELVFFVPDRDPTGAGVGMISYRGMVRLGLTVDEAMSATTEELDQLVAEFEKEVDNLYSNVVEKVDCQRQTVKMVSNRN